MDHQTVGQGPPPVNPVDRHSSFPKTVRLQISALQALQEYRAGLVWNRENRKPKALYSKQLEDELRAQELELCEALSRDLESGARYRLEKINTLGNRVLCHLLETDERVWVDCILDGDPIEHPRFKHVRALPSEALCSIVNGYRRAANLAKVHVGNAPSVDWMDLRNHAQVELERRFPENLDETLVAS
jgi:hypothetical protein